MMGKEGRKESETKAQIKRIRAADGTRPYHGKTVQCRMIECGFQKDGKGKRERTRKTSDRSGAKFTLQFAKNGNFISFERNKIEEWSILGHCYEHLLPVPFRSGGRLREIQLLRTSCGSSSI
jgi:hypothetical protein